MMFVTVASADLFLGLNWCATSDRGCPSPRVMVQSFPQTSLWSPITPASKLRHFPKRLSLGKCPSHSESQHVSGKSRRAYALYNLARTQVWKCIFRKGEMLDSFSLNYGLHSWERRLFMALSLRAELLLVQRFGGSAGNHSESFFPAGFTKPRHIFRGSL